MIDSLFYFMIELTGANQYLGWLTFLAWLSGLPTAWAMGKYLYWFTEREPNHAAAWDVFLMILGNMVALNLWSRADDSMLVQLAYVIGNGTGTWLITNKAKKDDLRKGGRAA